MGKTINQFPKVWLAGNETQIAPEDPTGLPGANLCHRNVAEFPTVSF